MHTDLVNQLKNIPYAYDIPPEALHAIRESANKVVNTLHRKIFKEPDLIKQFARTTFNELSEVELRIGHRRDKEAKLILETKDHVVRDHSDWLVHVLRELLIICEETRGYLLEFLIGYYPKEFASDRNWKVLEEIYPQSMVVKQSKARTIQQGESAAVKMREAPNLSLRQIALMAFYKGMAFNEEAMMPIIGKNGHKSFDKCRQHYEKWTSKGDRMAWDVSKSIFNHKCKDFKVVINVLSGEPKQNAENELSKIIEKYEEQRNSMI